MEERVFDTVEKAKRNLVHQCGSKRCIYTATHPGREGVFCVSANATTAKSDAGRFWRTSNLEAINVDELDYIYNDPDELENMVSIIPQHKKGVRDKTWLWETLREFPEFNVLFDG